MRKSISCAIVVFNEEQNIRGCLESVKWTDEIIVVDSFSEDRTVEICRDYTQRVFQRPWNGFGEQKNFAIDQATSDWVLILDADERVSTELRRTIENILSSSDPNEPVAYSLPRKNYYYGKWVRWAGCYPDYQLRLFRRGIGRHDNAEPHPKFMFQGEAGYLEVPLEHDTDPSIDHHVRKIGELTSPAAQQRWKTKKSVYWVDLTVRPLATFYKYYVTRKGFRDGMHGFLVSGFASMYTFVKYAKLWELLQAGSRQLPE